MTNISSNLSTPICFPLRFQFQFQFYSKIPNSLFIKSLRPFHKFTTKVQCTQASPHKPNKPKKQTMNNPNSTSKPYRKKSSYGTSRKSALKKSFSQEQVSFSGSVPSDPIVGIIGGGMSGLVCALYLEKRGIRSTVFDTEPA